MGAPLAKATMRGGAAVLLRARVAHCLAVPCVLTITIVNGTPIQFFGDAISRETAGTWHPLAC